MGDGIAFLIASRRLGADYGETLTLGRQSLLTDHSRLRAAFREGGEPIGRRAARQLVVDGRGYGEPLLRHLGARTVESLDASDYEGATLIHDLNQPLPEDLRQRFSVVLDGGTLEHIFNYPIALESALRAVRPGGHFIGITPTNGYLGHGFYQLSPEVLYRVLAHGFAVKLMLLRPVHARSHWRLVPDPVSVGSRVVWRSAWPTLLYVLAKRVDDEIEIGSVMQSDYEQLAWKADGASTALADEPRRLRTAVRSRMPVVLKEARDALTVWRQSHSQLDTVRLADVGRSQP